MYGILFTMFSSIDATATMHHIDGLPTKEIALKLANDWTRELKSYKGYIHSDVYEMEKPKQEEQPLFTYSTGPAGATINLTPEKLLDKVDMLCTKLDALKMIICDDATSTPLLIEEATLAHHLAHELWDALPNNEQDNPTNERQ